VMLRDGVPYREPEAGYMHQNERAKLVRHHAKRLRQLGADESTIEQLVARLTEPETCASQGRRSRRPPPSESARAARRKCAGELWDSGRARPESRSIRF
jgi:hypothetical protein